MQIISIHAPVWGATQRELSARPIPSCISIHAPVWGATLDKVEVTAEDLFQSTLPCGERRTCLWGRFNIPEFQSTLPCGERHSHRKQPHRHREFQSTLPCGERHELLPRYSDSTMISIHAPVWGATPGKTDKILSQLISIHAPVWGATGRKTLCTFCLQSISIHAPVWGATLASNHFFSFFHISIHAPVWGATPSSHSNMLPQKFQSTLPCGERRELACIRPASTDFNPRSRVGSDICLSGF